MSTYVVDTNVLLRTLQPAHSMYMSASRSIALLIKQGESLCVCPQSIYECWVVATRPLAQNGLGMTTDQIHSEIEVFKTYLSVLPDTPAIFPVWEQLVLQYSVKGKPAHDARIVAPMKAHGVTHLLTFNTGDFARYQGIIAVTPDSIVNPSPSPSNP